MAVQISGQVSTLIQSEASLALGLVLDPRPGEGQGACRSGEDMEDEVTGTFSASVLDRQWLGQSLGESVGPLSITLAERS